MSPSEALPQCANLPHMRWSNIKMERNAIDRESDAIQTSLETQRLSGAFSMLGCFLNGIVQGARGFSERGPAGQRVADDCSIDTVLSPAPNGHIAADIVCGAEAAALGHEGSGALRDGAGRLLGVPLTTQPPSWLPCAITAIGDAPMQGTHLWLWVPDALTAPANGQFVLVCWLLSTGFLAPLDSHPAPPSPAVAQARDHVITSTSHS
eukprot:CAMPEP_0181177784 /NCGR_PEP_ID=MMETSP1096-20121128/5355_1 /TAXON_ID=156174 ORGANISM="Chrysochromulina ericina, Strain CCMP281" /NCGR_SAMPLE_ID=MMETSP1096 /ASSEMBLY_ACC=CAM_ASM_000453 /LENGTH=207 /DNA_ID=CAMNT_0023265977 /DNA_START=429 /DNA_END=1053 /DNA_ORIENTATION=+